MTSTHAYIPLAQAPLFISELTPAETEGDGNVAVPSGSSMISKIRVQGLLKRIEKLRFEPVQKFTQRNAGLLLVASSQAFFSVMNVAVKKLNSLDTPVSTLELILVRMSITYICGIAYMTYAKIPDAFLGPREVRLLLALRGIFGFFGLFGIYFALEYLSLSDATVLTFIAPLFTGISGALILKEKFTIKQFFAGLFSLFGVVLIARPTFIFGDFPMSEMPASLEVESIVPEDPDEKGGSTDRLIAVGVSLIGVCGTTGAFTSIRAIGKRAHPLHTMSAFSLFCVIVSGICMIVTKTPFTLPTRFVWLLLLAQIGMFGFIAQVLLTMGLQRETVGRGSLALYTQIIFATILERIFFHSVSSALSILGTLIIVGSALYIALTNENEMPKKKTHISLENMDAATFLEEGLLDTDIAKKHIQESELDPDTEPKSNDSITD